MRYIKKLALNKKDPQSNRFSVLQDDRIVTTSLTSIEMPTGGTADRPTTLVDGTVRYNTDLHEFEVYNNANPFAKKPWEIIRTVRPAKITSQTLGYGNGLDQIFGPLNPDYNITAATPPQNILVFTGPAFQIANTNYTLTDNPAASTATLTVSTSSGVTTLYLNTLTNFDTGSNGYWRTVSAPTGIQVGTTVTNIITTYNPTFGGWPVSISLPTNNSISLGTVITVSYPTGTFVQFTGGGNPVGVGVPVVALLGFDGYFPPLEV